MSRIDTSTIDNDLESIKKVINRDKHFLGEADTLKRMNTDFSYPKSAKRLSPEVWIKEKDNTMLIDACKRLEELLSSNFESHLGLATLKKLETDFDINLDIVFSKG